MKRIAGNRAAAAVLAALMLLLAPSQAAQAVDAPALGNVLYADTMSADGGSAVTEVVQTSTDDLLINQTLISGELIVELEVVVYREGEVITAEARAVALPDGIVKTARTTSQSREDPACEYGCEYAEGGLIAGTFALCAYTGAFAPFCALGAGALIIAGKHICKEANCPPYLYCEPGSWIYYAGPNYLDGKGDADCNLKMTSIKLELSLFDDTGNQWGSTVTHVCRNVKYCAEEVTTRGPNAKSLPADCYFQHVEVVATRNWVEGDGKPYTTTNSTDSGEVCFADNAAWNVGMAVLLPNYEAL